MILRIRRSRGQQCNIHVNIISRQHTCHRLAEHTCPPACLFEKCTGHQNHMIGLHTGHWLAEHYTHCAERSPQCFPHEVVDRMVCTDVFCLSYTHTQKLTTCNRWTGSWCQQCKMTGFMADFYLEFGSLSTSASNEQLTVLACYDHNFDCVRTFVEPDWCSLWNIRLYSTAHCSTDAIQVHQTCAMTWLNDIIDKLLTRRRQHATVRRQLHVVMISICNIL